MSAHETLKALHQQITAARMVMRDSPEKITMHPWSYEDLLLDQELTRYGQTPSFVDWHAQRLFGLPIVEDTRLPEDVIVLHGPGDRVVLMRKIETTQYRAIVRDGVRRAHPWLRLPDPVPPAKGDRWVTWVFEHHYPWPVFPRTRLFPHHVDAVIYGLPVMRPDSFVKMTSLA